MAETKDIWAENIDAYQADLRIRLHKIRDLALSLPLEPMATDPDSLHRLFRAAHSLKGDTSIMGIMEVSARAHDLEDILAAIRDEGANFGEEEKAHPISSVEAISAEAFNVIKRMNEERKVSTRCPER